MAKIFGEKYSTLETKTAKERSVSRKPDEIISKPAKERAGNGGIRKEYLNDTENVCRVTFTLPKEAVKDSESVCIVGEFNNWDVHANPMKKREDGSFATVCDLESDREYQFRYLIDESIWENDWNADRYVESCYGDCDNSVVVT